ncbi:late cornified envelope protein 7A [Cavia porcellus]|uniref:late cornified envelope protein 7A n=1 Tax=Cavia porcellus TaxID=10141 RepID=UPI002FE20DDA
MSYKQNQQKCQFPAKCPPKCLLDCHPQCPQAPSSCPPSGSPPASSFCVSTRVSLVSYRFPRFYLHQPQCSNCCENLSSGCPGCCHNSGGCN